MTRDGRDEARSRASALELLRSAKQIFVAYSSSDLRAARDIRRRIRGLRPDKNKDSVFLAAESLPSGAPVSPQVLEEQLRKADLFVVVCGKTTHLSAWVAREVEIARARLGRGLRILPIILRSAERLPRGLEFERDSRPAVEVIQGIHAEVLFPQLFWRRVMRVATAVALVALAGTAAWLEVSRRSDRAASEIQTWLELDATQTPSPIDVARGTELDRLAALADRYRLSEASQLRALRARLPDPDESRSVLPPDSTRRALVTWPSRATVWIAHPSRIAFFGPDGTRHASELWDDGVVAPWETGDPPEIDGPRRKPAAIVSFGVDPASDALLVEVDYDGPSRGADGRLQRDSRGRWWFPDTGAWIEGSERERFRVHDDGRVTSLGLTRRLVWTASSNPLGEQTGGSQEWFEIGRSDEIPNPAPESLREAECRALEEWRFMEEFPPSPPPPCTDGTVLLRRVWSGDAGSLLEVEFYTDPGGRIQELMAGARTHLILWHRPGSALQPVTDWYTYHSRAKYIYFEDPSPDDPELHSVPRECPVGALSLDREVAAVCGGFWSLADGSRIPAEGFEAEAGLSEAWFTIGGGHLAVGFEDGSFNLISPVTGRVEHRLVRPPWVRDVTVSPDGREFWVLLGNGAVQAWSVGAFGPDGWAAESGP